MFLLLFVFQSLFVRADVPESPRIEKYPLSSGDTLSSVSKLFFGDEKYWPKIWSKSVRDNRTLLKPGHSIKLFLGDEDEPPAFAISEGEETETREPAMAKPMIQPVAKRSNSILEIPPPQVQPKPVLKEFPPSIPEYQLTTRSGKSPFADYGVEILPRKKVNPDDKQFLPVYVQDDEVRADGRFLRSTLESTLATNGDEVFVRMRQGTAQEGAHYMLVHDVGRLEKSPYFPQGEKHYGHVVRVLGEIEMGGLADSPDNGSWEYRRAKMVHSIGLTLRDALVIPGKIPSIGLGSSALPTGLSAEIIGGNYDSKGMVFAEGSWVFINRGERDGVQANQLIWVNTSLEAHGDDTPIYVGNTQAALVKIAKTSGNVSTGIILSSKEAIMQGDGVSTAAPAAAPGGVDSESLDSSGAGFDPGDNLEELN